MKMRFLLAVAMLAGSLAMLACEVEVRTKCDDAKKIRMDTYRDICDSVDSTTYKKLLQDMAAKDLIALDDGMTAADVAPAEEPDDCDHYLLKDAEKCLSGTMACEDEITNTYEGHCL